MHDTETKQPADAGRLQRPVGRLGPERKARPVRLVPGRGYIECAPAEATHLTLRIPGPTGLLTLPVVQGSTTRNGTGCWTWNGSTDAPTLRPSVLTQYDGADRQWRCHSWINDGAAQFLPDCSHDMANTTVPLLDVDEPPNVGVQRRPAHDGRDPQDGLGPSAGTTSSAVSEAKGL